MNEPSPAGRSARVVAWLLALSYGLFAPVTAIMEYRDQTLSERFDLPPALIHITCLVQVVCALGVLHRPTAVWAAAILSFTTVGAIGAHVRIGSPWTAATAVVFTAVQIWFGIVSRARAR